VESIRELEIHRGDDVQVVPLGRQFVLGSREDADVRLEAKGVSPTHVMINPASRGAYLLVGYDSGMPVLVNDERISGGTRLVDGDTVDVDSVRLAFRFSPNPDAPAQSPAYHPLTRLLEVANSARDVAAFLRDVLAITSAGVGSSTSAVMVEAGGRIQVVTHSGETGEEWRTSARKALFERSPVHAELAGEIKAVFVPLLGLCPGAVLCHGRPAAQEPFSPDDIEFLTTAAHQTAIAIRRLRVMREASALQEDVLEISEQEQRRIGLDLHDGLCQDLLGIAFLAKHLERGLTDVPGLAVEAGRVVKLLNAAMGRARGLAHGLCPMGLEEYGLAAAFREMAADTAHMFSIECTFTEGEEIEPPPNTVSNHLYYLIREAVTNAAKHSGGSKIEIAMRQVKGRLVLVVSDDGTGVLVVSDDGTGVLVSGKGSMGMRTMRYRARLIGADLSFDQRVGGGTVVRCSLRKQVTDKTALRTFLVSPAIEPVLLFVDAVFQVGRARGSDVRIRSERVSRRHAEIRWDGDRYTLADLGSTNGTELNGMPVHGARRLVGEDVISFAGCEVRVVEVGPNEDPEQLNMGTQAIYPKGTPMPPEGEREAATAILKVRWPTDST
jgi:signal transduction histidine kinase/pSer/pThr/pTyr-binding forkhead associated (FHA) protein